MTTRSPRTGKAGFTLVELAIVLVIIGLIVGGVLVGQDLIKAAGIRAVVSDLEKYNAAANTFRGKFNAYPGDLTPASATQFFGAAASGSRTGTAGHGDGNGLIESATTAQGLWGETAMFWQDLSLAQLNSFRPALYTDNATAAVITAANIPNTIPTTRLRTGSFVHIYALAGRNYYYVGNITGPSVVTTSAIPVGNGVTPLEAISIDEKMDDSVGATGTVLAVSAITTNALNTNNLGAAVDCTNSAAGAYNADADGNGINCMLSIRASF